MADYRIAHRSAERLLEERCSLALRNAFRQIVMDTGRLTHRESDNDRRQYRQNAGSNQGCAPAEELADHAAEQEGKEDAAIDAGCSD